MIYGQLSRVEAMYGFIVIGKKTFREILSKAERRNANDNNSFYTICSKCFYRTRELESWVPNLTRPKDRAMQDGAEAINYTKRLSNKEQYLSLAIMQLNKNSMCLERAYYEKGKAVNRCANRLRKYASTTECSIELEQVGLVGSLIPA